MVETADDVVTNTQVVSKNNFVCRPCVTVCLQVGANRVRFISMNRATSASRKKHVAKRKAAGRRLSILLIVDQAPINAVILRQCSVKPDAAKAKDDDLPSGMDRGRGVRKV